MGNTPMSRPEMALAIHEQRYGHSVTFADLEGGGVLLSTGSEFRLSEDGGLRWSAPWQGIDVNGDAISGSCASLVRLGNGGLGLATKAANPPSDDPYDSRMVFRRSGDGGRTWSAPVVTNDGLLRAHALQDVMLRSSSGRIILPAYFVIGQGSWHHENAPFVGGYLNGNFVSTDAHFFDPHFGASYVLYSDDDGETWQQNRDGELLITMTPDGIREPTFEPSVAEIEPGRLLMLMRTRLGRLFEARSDDDGETWSRPQPTQLAGTQAPGQVRRLPATGDMLVVWTQQSADEIRRGFIRTRLSSAISRNRGGLWEHFQNVESLHEALHVTPGPLEVIRPEECYGVTAGRAATTCDADLCDPLPEGYGRWSYPSVLALEDRILISHSYSIHDPVTGEATPAGGSKLKVLPLEWLYGDDDPERESSIVRTIEDQFPRP